MHALDNLGNFSDIPGYEDLVAENVIKESKDPKKPQDQLRGSSRKPSKSHRLMLKIIKHKLEERITKDELMKLNNIPYEKTRYDQHFVHDPPLEVQFGKNKDQKSNINIGNSIRNDIPLIL